MMENSPINKRRLYNKINIFYFIRRCIKDKKNKDADEQKRNILYISFFATSKSQNMNKHVLCSKSKNMAIKPILIFWSWDFMPKKRHFLGFLHLKMGHSLYEMGH